MTNQNGNITSIGLVFLLAIVSIGSIALINKSNDIKKHKSIFRNFLCVKEVHGRIKDHKKMIHVTNNIIHLANLGQMVGLFTNPGVHLAAKEAKALTQKAQAFYHISFLENIRSLFAKSCIFSPSVVKTHFQTTSVFKLKRDINGVVKKRSEKWGFLSGNASSLIKSKISSDSVKTKVILY